MRKTEIQYDLGVAELEPNLRSVWPQTHAINQRTPCQRVEWDIPKIVTVSRLWPCLSTCLDEKLQTLWDLVSSEGNLPVWTPLSKGVPPLEQKWHSFKGPLDTSQTSTQRFLRMGRKFQGHSIQLLLKQDCPRPPLALLRVRGSPLLPFQATSSFSRVNVRHTSCLPTASDTVKALNKCILK